jgi:hypothetical protein
MSNRSSGQSDGGFGVTDGNALAMSGIPPCCQEISVGPRLGDHLLDELLLIARAVAGVRVIPSRAAAA